MNTRLCEYLIKLEETGSLSKAASEVSISPSALSQQLTLIEKELGVKLFIYNGRRWEPTEAGLCYLKGAREFVRTGKETCGRIKEMGRESQVRIALCPEAVLTAGEGLMRALKEGGVQDMSLIEASSEEAAGLMLSGKLDAAIVSLSSIPASLTSDVLYRESLVLAVPPGCPDSFIVPDFPDLRDRAVNLRPEGRRHKVSSLGLLIMMLDSGLGKAVLPSRAAIALRGCDLSPVPGTDYDVSLMMPRYKPKEYLKDIILSIR